MSALVEMPNWPEMPRIAFDPQQESDRLDALHSLHLLDTPAEERFDRITQLAAQVFCVPIAYVAFLDGERQWFKSRHGLCVAQTSQSTSFCQYTIQKDEPLIILDTQLHPVHRTHPMVVGDPFVRFYAGVPLCGKGGLKVGTFCLVDLVPREFDQEQITRLQTFASLVEREINLGQLIQTQHELLETREELLRTQQHLDREFADATKYVRMMLHPPLKDHEIIDWQFHPSTHLGGDGLGYRRINEDKLAFYILDVTGHGLGSALLAVTALELLRNPVAQVDFSRPSTVIDRLNRTFQMKDHAGKFFSVWYGVYSRSAGTITYANAGHPPPLLVTREDGKPKLTQTEYGGSVLGIMPDLKVKEMTLNFPPGSELHLFTDGLYELREIDGGHGSYDEFRDWLDSHCMEDRSVWDAMLRWLHLACAKDVIDDDVTLLRFATGD